MLTQKNIARLCTILFALSAVIMAGCAPSATLTPKPEPKGGGGTFRVVLPAEPTSLNPDLRSDDAAFVIGQNIYNKLLTLDTDYRVMPDLAESWEVSTDGLTYTFHLAKNVKWHDGQLFTSADVKWTFETIASGNGVRQSTAERVAEIQTPDANTVIIRLKEAWSPFIPTIAWYGTFILPKHIYDGSDWSKNPANEKPIGTGPFKFSEWVKGDHVTLTANLDFSRRGPFLDTLTFRMLKDPSTGIDLVIKGDADYTLATPPRDQIAQLKQTPRLKVQTFPHPGRYYFGFNTRRKPMDDLRVRQAVNMAINRNVLVDRAMLGYGAPGLGFYTPAIPWAYNLQANVPAFDATKAEELLNAAGMSRGTDGMRAKWALITFNASPFKELATNIQEQLHTVGIECEIFPLAQADWNKRSYQDHDFDLALTNGTWGPDPDNLSVRFGANGDQQFVGYVSADFEAALAEGARQTKLEDRAKSYFRAQEILAKDLPFAPLVENVSFVLARDTVTGLPLTEARGLVTFNDYSLVRVKR